MFSLSSALTDCYVLPVGLRAPMIISCLLKNRFTSILVILLTTLHISSCGTGDNLTAATADINLDTGTDTVADNGNNSTIADINLSWVAPTEREDNTSISLSEVAGYQVFYGMARGQYSKSITINDGTAVDYTFTDLPSGTYYFVVTTIDTEGRESQYSPEVTVVI